MNRLMLFCFAFPLMGMTAELAWNGGDGAFADATKWAGGILPVAGDSIRIPADSTVQITDTDRDRVEGIALFTLEAATSRLQFDFSEEMNLAAPIKGAGQVLKTGTGHLRYQSLTSSSDYFYTGGTIVSNGVLELVPGWVGSNGLQNYSYAPMKIYAPGQLYTVTNGNTCLDELWGDGTVTNLYTGNDYCQLRIMKGPSSFEGKITGKMRWYSSGTIDLLGEESDFPYSGFQIFGGGDSGAAKMGMRGQPSSIGAGSSIAFRDGGGRFRYLGTGETTDRVVEFWGRATSAILDAGAHGGLVFSEKLTAANPCGLNNPVVLTGSNTTPAVIAGPIYESSYRGTNTAIQLAKRGTGTWRMEDHPDRRNAGAIYVEEGTLEFTSLAETNEVCSLGLATRLTLFKESLFKPEVFVPYAISLGGEGTVGTLSYVGTNRCGTTTRAFVLTGDGRVENNGSGVISLYSGFGTLRAEERTLALGGTSSADNVISRLGDGEGVLSVTKEGAGTWRLSGENTFSGALSVNGGTLQIDRRENLWYRFVLRDTAAGTNSPDSNVCIQEFALYDAQGNRHGLGMTKGEGASPETLAPNTFMITPQPYLFYTSRDGDKLFDEVVSGAGFCIAHENAPHRLEKDKPETWFYVTVRLPDDTPEITSYDIYTMGQGSDRYLVGWTLECSQDGLRWTVVDQKDDFAYPNSGWYSDYSAFVANAVRTGFPMVVSEQQVESIPNVASVSVADGGRLESLGNPLPISSLWVDYSRESGVMANVLFSEKGQLSVDSLPSSGGVLPIRFESASGLENVAAWDVLVDGVPAANWICVAKNGQISLAQKGTILFLK